MIFRGWKALAFPLLSARGMLKLDMEGVEIGY